MKTLNLSELKQVSGGGWWSGVSRTGGAIALLGALYSFGRGVRDGYNSKK